MSDLTSAVLLFGLVCVMTWVVVAYALVKGDWWRR